MKMKREHKEIIGGYGDRSIDASFSPAAAAPAPEILAGGGGKGKMTMVEEQLQQDAGVDELLAALGYKVRSSDMADVAHKMEQLEMAMGGSAAADDALLAHLASDTVHYNPSDLSTWLESMLTELNASPPPPPPAGEAYLGQYHYDLPPLPSVTGDSSSIFDPLDPAESSTITSAEFPKIPVPAGDATAAESAAATRDRKRMRTSPSSSSSSTAAAAPSPAAMPVVVDAQEAGIRLVHVLMACAEAVQQENLPAADALVKQVSGLAASQGGAMRKVAGYFAEALARRIYKPIQQQQQVDRSIDTAFSDILQMHFYESSPYLKFAHFTANQAILEAFAGCRRVHVVDFGMKQGLQWPALMQALALRPGGPPAFRLTGIGPPQPDGSDALQQVGWKLAQLADSMRVSFEYRGLVASSLADLDLEHLTLGSRRSTDAREEPEAVAVNSIFELHRLLARPREAEKVLGTIRALRPRIVTVVEQEASHNSGTFMERFTEALHYYSSMFDSLEGGGGGGSGAASAPAAATAGEDLVMSEVYLGRQICNVVACEGADRTERHETLAQWRRRFAGAGFEPVHLGSNAFKQASMLLALFSGGDEYRVEEREGCLTLGWHTRPLIATSAWRVAGAGVAR